VVIVSALPSSYGSNATEDTTGARRREPPVHLDLGSRRAWFCVFPAWPAQYPGANEDL